VFFSPKTDIFSAIVASFIIESYKMLFPDFGNQTSFQPSPPPAASIIIVKHNVADKSRAQHHICPVATLTQ
jgi:hypothetical protein